MRIEERAEQYADTKVENRKGYNARWELVKQAYIAGYNDTLEEMQKNGLALQSDMDKTIEQNFALKRELEKVNVWHKVADGDLSSEVEELKVRNGALAGQVASLNRWLGEAKSIISEVLKKTYGEGWNYSLDVKTRAEQFLKEE